MRILGIVVVVVICSCTSTTNHRVEAVHQRLKAAHDALDQLPTEEQGELRAALTRAERAIERFERLARQGRSRQQTEEFLKRVAALALVDDATVGGIADDALLPLLILGVIATRLAMEAPAPPQALADAWRDVLDTLQAVGTVAEAAAIEAARRYPHPDFRDCTAHLNGCLGTKLGRPHSGGTWGHSICKDCFDQCTGQGKWPRQTGDGKNCRWWMLKKN